MASGSPRARIDQFFASKKRKPQSPGFKHGRNQKDIKPIVQGSPSAKGKLESFLVTSQDDNDTANPLYSTHSSTVKQDPDKRSLELEINTSTEDKHPCMSTDVRSKSIETLDTFQEGVSKGSSDNAAAGPTSGSVSGHGAPNSELRQFANDFLSLYCSELQTTTSKLSEPEASDHKRHGSPSLLAQEDKATKKRHCIANQSTLERDTICSIEKKTAEVQTGPLLGNGESIFYSSELPVGDKPSEPQSSLRKCSKSSNPLECYTPCSYAIQACTRDTPKSIRGSSIFSPGEAFWNEAIQLADGLCIPADNFSANAAEESNHAESHYDMNNLLSNGNCDGKPKDLLDEGCSRVGHMKMGASLWLPEKHKKDLDAEVSPLPVKHFDFSHEGKFLEDCVQNHSAVDGLTQIKDQVKRLEYGSASHVSIKTQCCNSQINKELSEEQGMASVHVLMKKKMLLNQDNHHNTSSSPVNGLRNVAGNLENSGSSTPSSFVALKDRLELYSWLPPEICNAYIKKGISKLYPWQVDCLQVDGVLQRRNLVYCASTSAGKSFVAEILMLRRVISTGKIALLVLPYVSICAEKAEHLEALLEPLGKQVRSYYGSQGGGILPKDTSVAVCTIEKANSLVNRLLEEGCLSEIGIIVIDELHMVGDQNRGYLLELMLTKLRYAAGEGTSEQSSGESSGLSSGKADSAHGLQIVGMSATMPNVAAVADWLQAALYETDFRPVPLEEYIKVGSTIYNKEMDIVRTIPKAAELSGKDPDHIVELCNEVVQEGHSVLIFCSSRKGCESTARHISKFLKKFSVDVRDANCQFVNVTSAIDALRRCPAGLDPILEETFYSGVAYHHAGLTVEEREIVESCYRGGLLRVLTATSTLAAGVNLPARRVIFRQPRIGRDFIDGTRYRQMAGRAGRTGIDTKGESVLLCKPEDVKRIMGLLNENCPPLHSCLREDLNGMTHAILEVVAGGIVQTSNDINRYVRCTLLNSTKPFQDVVKSAQDSLRWLCHRKFLEWNEDTKLYSTTPLGRAAFGSSLCPEESLTVLDDLSRAREGFVLASDLHLVYLVTPINVEVEPDWELFYERFMQLSALDQSVGNRVGVAEPFLMRMAHGAPVRTSNKSKDSVKGLHGKFKNQPGIMNSNVLSDEETLRVCKRFYVALILSRIVQEVPVAEVCETFKVARGMVQALQENAGRFASMVSVFCERLGWHDLEGLVGKFQNRVSFGVRAEVVELTTIPYVKGSRARALYKAGLRSPLAIAEASILEIVKALFESSSWATDEGSTQRRLQVGVAKKIKNGARKIVLDKAEEARVAAFTAFKSLGYSVPQFSRPVLLAANKEPISQVGPATFPVEEEISTSYGDAKQIEHILSTPCKPCIEETDNLDKLASERQIEKKNNEAGNAVVASVEVTSTSSMSFPAVPQDVSVMAENKLDDAYLQPIENGIGTLLFQSRTDYQFKTTDGQSDFGKQGEHKIQDLCPGGKDNTYEKGPITSISTPGGFDSFLDIWSSVQEFYFDIHYYKRAEVNYVAPYEIHGIAICWEGSPVYYVNLPKDLMSVDKKKTELLPMNESCDTSYTSSPDHRLKMLKQRWKRITEIMGKTSVRKFTWNLKIQIQVLKSAVVSVQRFGCSGFAKEHMGLELIDSSYLLLSPVHISNGLDLCIMAWILWPDDERSSNSNLEKEIKKRLSSEVAAAANRDGRWKNQMRRAAHNGCCRRVAQIRALCSHLWKLLISEALIEPFLTIETPLVSILADMELWGVGVDMEGCIRARNLLVKKLKRLEMEAYKLAGMKFSLYTAADIANVLFVHLKLPIPEGHKKGKQHQSTDKHCLDLLRHEHPIIPVIKEHRTLAKLLNCTLGSICSFARLSMQTQKHTLHGRWLQTSTATGRLSMEEPNLQCVEHMVDFKMSKDGHGGEADCDHHTVNARDFFVPTQEDWLLLTADYSQIELRLMAHFSRDSSLIELLSNPHGDVFTMIAAKWTGKPLESVSSDERDQTKRLVYGILYGMGANTLAEQLDCSSDEAKEKIKSFRSSFPGIVSWLHGAVASCHQKGYIETIKGRKRFLSKIQFGNSKEKSKAQRQAVNSICQGSAADIIKIAMKNIYSVIVEGSEMPDSSISFSMLKGCCRLLLQVHDELVLEVDPSVIKEAALLLQTSMESAATLLVPLHVKLKAGRTWGSLKAFEADQYEDIRVSDS